MRIRITAGGIYGAEGKEVPVGTEIDVENEPTGWAGRYDVIGDSAGKTAVTNEDGPTGPFTVKDDGNGWHGVYDAEGQKVKSLRKDDADAFAALSADDQLAFVKEG